MPLLIACIKISFSHDKVLKLKIGPPKDVHIKGLTLKAPIMTAPDDNFCDIFPNCQKK